MAALDRFRQRLRRRDASARRGVGGRVTRAALAALNLANAGQRRALLAKAAPVKPRSGPKRVHAWILSDRVRVAAWRSLLFSNARRVRGSRSAVRFSRFVS
jgi:hypothetical protein